jgi:hypothetical protein
MKATINDSTVTMQEGVNDFGHKAWTDLNCKIYARTSSVGPPSGKGSALLPNGSSCFGGSSQASQASSNSQNTTQAGARQSGKPLITASLIGDATKTIAVCAVSMAARGRFVSQKCFRTKSCTTRDRNYGFGSTRRTSCLAGKPVSFPTVSKANVPALTQGDWHTGKTNDSKKANRT